MSHLADFDHKGVELSESVKKGKIVMKIFLDKAEVWSSKNKAKDLKICENDVC